MNTNKIIALRLLFFMVIFHGMAITEVYAVEVSNINNIQNTIDWDKISKTYIFFAHQSVGDNIIDGISELMKNKPLTLDIKETRNIKNNTPPLFAHTKIGKNRFPESKILDFKNLIDNEIGDKVEIAIFKLCYVDFSSITDTNKLFTFYTQQLNSLQKKHPNIVFITSTVPLTVNQSGLTALIKRLIGIMPSGILENRNRHHFNELLRERYAMNNRLFDIAKFESTLPDNTRKTYFYEHKKYYMLYNRYSSDGSHLNKTGSKMLAQKLLQLLTIVLTKEAS